MAGEKSMTTKELEAFIRDQVAPMIKDTVGPMVAELVRESVNQTIQARSAEGTRVASLLATPGERDGDPRGKGLAFARGIRAIAAAKILGGGAERAIQVLHGWGDKDLAEQWEAGRQKALAAGDPTAGGFLVPIQFSQDIIELLRPSAVVRSLDPSIMPMPMGSVKVPKITQGATASYIGENANITQSQEGTGQLTLTFKKLAALVPLSNDLVRYSSPAADSIVRDDMVRAMATREDKAFIRDDGTSGTPRGIKNWIHAANKFDANGTVNLANVTIDLGKAIQRLMAADVPLVVQQFPAGGPNQVQPVTARPGWIMSPRTYMYLTTVQNGQGFYAFRPEMMTGTLWGFPYRVTSQVLETMTSAFVDTGGTQTELYFGAFAHAVIGEALGLMVDASMEAAYANAAGTVVAAFSQDQTVVRVLAEHDFALRYDKAFALIQKVTWGA
jgi:HK97 family phage major capsid protein